MGSREEGARGGAAVVSGGASGIGQALGEELALRGVRVTIADRQVERGEQVAEGIRAAGGSAEAVELDVRDRERFQKVVAEAHARSGRLDYLFNNAGIGIGCEMADYDAVDWDEVIDVNLRGVAYGVLAAYPLMIRQGFGHIVNTASMAGLGAAPFLGSYTAAKHGVVGLSKTLRIEARRYGVRVSVICPGVIRTPILEGGRYGRMKVGLDPKAFVERFERFRPMAPRELARRVLRALDRNRAIIVEPRWWRVIWWIERLAPRLGEALSTATYRQMLRELEEVRKGEAR